MRLIYIANSRIPTEKANGIQIVKTCEALAKAGVDVQLWLPQRKQYDQLSKQDPFIFYNCTTRFPIKRLPTIDLLIAANKLPHKVQLCLYFLQEASFLASLTMQGLKDKTVYSRSITACVVAKILGAKSYYEIHNITESRYMLAVHRFMWRFINGVAGISGGLEKFLQKEGVTNTVTIPDAVDPNQFGKMSKNAARRKLKMSPQERIVVYTGSMHERKGVFVLAHAAKLLSKRGIKVYFVGGVFSGPDLQNLQKYCRDHRINNVIFTGFVEPKLIPDYTSLADVVVLPDSAKLRERREFTSPMKLFEYLATGVPIVASGTTAIREILTNNVNAIIVSPDNPKELANAIWKLIKDTKLAKKISTQARKDSHKYSWEERAKKIIDFVNR